MYPYSDRPSNENYQGTYPPAYQPTPDYYRPMSSMRHHRRHNGWSFGTVALVWLVLAVVIGHHFIFWAFLFFGAYLFMKGRTRRQQYRQNYAQPPQFDQANYYYPPTSRPDYFYGQTYEAKSEPNRPTGGWPAPYDTTHTDRNY